MINEKELRRYLDDLYMQEARHLEDYHLSESEEEGERPLRMLRFVRGKIQLAEQVLGE